MNCILLYRHWQHSEVSQGQIASLVGAPQYLLLRHKGENNITQHMIEN